MAGWLPPFTVWAFTVWAVFVAVVLHAAYELLRYILDRLIPDPDRAWRTAADAVGDNWTDWEENPE